MARDDGSALQFPLPDRLYGFCAQQACEKFLKAWIATLGEAYPLTHNLASLVRRLRAMGEVLPNLPVQLSLLQPFAVQFRYDEGASLTEDERTAIRETVDSFQDFVLKRILEIEAVSPS